MEKLPDLSSLTPEAKDALIERLWEELQNQRKSIEGLKSRPKKTSQNSSKPPSKGFKANKAKKKGGERREASVGRAGGGRKLHANPNQRVSAHLQCCPSCHESIPLTSQHLHSRYDKIELPPIAPVVTRVERYCGECLTCGYQSVATVPPELAAGSPFGETIERFIAYLRYGHAISYQRLQQLCKEVFNLSISEGAIANLLSRVKTRLEKPLGEIQTRLQQSALICSDETSARVEGRTEWEWVFQNEDVCLHVICPSRGANVIYAVLGEHTPATWVSDMFSAQRCHPGQQWQVCLAHQLRDTQYAIDAGDEVFAPAMKQLFLDALKLHKRRDQLAVSTRYQYRLAIQRRLRKLLSLDPSQTDGQRLKKRYETILDNLFLFLEDDSIPPTNNSSEQAIRMSALFRKVTNGFRSEWGKELFAAVRSVVNTGQRQGLSALQSIEAALSAQGSLFLPS